MSYQRVLSLAELKNICEVSGKEFFIWFGGARSSKYIQYNRKTDTFYIQNNIDGSDQEVKTKDLVDKTNIIKAIYAGNFYLDEWINP